MLEPHHFRLFALVEGAEATDDAHFAAGHCVGGGRWDEGGCEVKCGLRGEVGEGGWGWGGRGWQPRNYGAGREGGGGGGRAE